MYKIIKKNPAAISQVIYEFVPRKLQLVVWLGGILPFERCYSATYMREKQVYLNEKLLSFSEMTKRTNT